MSDAMRDIRKWQESQWRAVDRRGTLTAAWGKALAPAHGSVTAMRSVGAEKAPNGDPPTLMLWGEER